jgi:hypothetical protein
MNVKYNLKRGLHRVFPGRFIPSRHKNVRTGKFVPDERKDEPGVVTFGRLFPKKEHKAKIRQVRPITDFMPRWMLEADIEDSWDWRAVKMADGTVKDFTCNQGFNQGPKGSCTAPGSTGMCGNLELVAGTFPKGGLCKLWIYNDARNRDGLLNPPQEGAYMITVMTAAKEDGICREALKPYDVNDPEFDSWPFKRQALMMEDAENFKIKDFALVDPEGMESQWVDLMCRAIRFFGVIDMGTPWTSDWSQNLTGHMKVPTGGLDGGHSWDTLAYLVLERDANGKITKALFYGRNSWDAEWPLGTTTGDFDYPSETLNCAKWIQYGGSENYRAITAETHVCPENEHWSFTDGKCVPDGSGPQPTNCDQQYDDGVAQCDADFQRTSDIWAWIYCFVQKLVTWVTCTYGTAYTVSKKTSYTGTGKKRKKKLTLTVTEK